jgi:DNA-binding transcriptional ArsR family regulator
LPKFNIDLFLACWLTGRDCVSLTWREMTKSACFFVETLNTNNPKISRHLAYLKRANLISRRRDGKWMHYRISEPDNEKAREVFQGIMVNAQRI